MRSHDEFDPGLREFHPDFGYLYPSRRLRSRVRLALSAAIFGILVGAIGATLLSGRSTREPARIDTALTLRPVSVDAARPVSADAARPVSADAARQSTPQPTMAPDDAPLTPTPVDGPATAVPPKPESPPAATGEPPAADGPRLATAGPADPSTETECKEETWPYFDRQCLWGPGKEQSAPAAAAKASAAAAARRAPIAAVEAPVAPEQQTAAPKKKTRTVAARPRREASESRRTSRRNAYAQFGGPFGGFWRNNRNNYAYEPRREWRGWSSW